MKEKPGWRCEECLEVFPTKEAKQLHVKKKHTKKITEFIGGSR